MPSPRDSTPSALVPEITVRTYDGRTYRFRTPFLIGRDHTCHVRVDDGRVSRRHAQVSYEHGEWRLEDLESGNGVYVGDRRVQAVPIKPALSVRLGPEGPTIELEADMDVGETIVLADYMERYFKPTGSDRPAGKDTVMIRKAFERVQRKQRRTYSAIIGVVAAIAIAAGGYAYYAQVRLARQQSEMQEIFYDMKGLDVDMARLEATQATNTAQNQDAVRLFQERRRLLEARYERILDSMGDRRYTPEEQAVLRVTRLFGECEAVAPPEYMAEVMTYVRQWRSTGRFARAVRLAQEKGYIPRIVLEFQRQNLSPQFFYLALQESDFVEDATGPMTRFGYAKGMWMFIPDTARRFGLTIGPLAAQKRPDPADDRHNWEKSTKAAAAYIKEIYYTDAQASGLLVVASYNWGERRVVDLLRKMPANPRERNFWKLLLQHRERIPPETYDYVFRIVSAAAIGENPRLFGFDFDNPLTSAGASLASAQ